jgi:hypothetical protein
MFKNWLGKKEAVEPDMPGDDISEEAYLAWHEDKERRMEAALGKVHEKVLHVIIADPKYGPFHGYFYHNDVPGTGVATMQLARLEGDGPSNSHFEMFEFISFTRAVVGKSDDLRDVSGETPGGLIRAAQMELGGYAYQAQLDPGNTLEFPADYDDYVGGKCYVIDAYKPEMFTPEFGLMLVIEIHRDEMAWALDNHGTDLIEKLKEAGVYPYSDLDRPSVISGVVN